MFKPIKYCYGTSIPVSSSEEAREVRNVIWNRIAKEVEADRKAGVMKVP